MSESKVEDNEEPVGSYLCYSLIAVIFLDLLCIDSKGSPRPFFVKVATMVVFIACAAWLVFKRCKFTAGQMLLALLLMGTEMAFLAYFKPLRFMPASDLIFIGCLPVLAFIGLFIGTRLAAAPKVQSSTGYWVRFLVGLLLPTLLMILSELHFALSLYSERRP